MVSHTNVRDAWKLCKDVSYHKRNGTFVSGRNHPPQIYNTVTTESTVPLIVMSEIAYLCIHPASEWCWRAVSAWFSSVLYRNDDVLGQYWKSAHGTAPKRSHCPTETKGMARNINFNSKWYLKNNFVDC